MNEETAPINWHTMDPEEIFKRLDSGKDGLDQAQAKQRLEKAGSNALEAEEGISPFRLLARQVHNPLIYLLIGAAVLSWFIGHRIDAAVIGGVIVLNTLLGFFQEWRALGTLLLFRFRGGTDVACAQTIAFSAMVGFEWFQALNARSQRLSVFSIGLFSNRWLLLGVGTATLLRSACCTDEAQIIAHSVWNIVTR